MKKIILLLSVVSVFAACKNNSSPAYNKNLVLVDTTGLSTSNAMTDAAKADKGTTWASSTKQDSRVSDHAVYPDNNAPTSTTATSTTTTTTSTVPKRDKGWSSAAKGTAIGAGTGAIVGAIVTKNAKGAIIGAMIGGGGGYAIGRSKDRKSGRVARAKARRAAGY